MNVLISARARADLFEIEAYISRDNPDRARSFVDELIGRIAVIGDRPRSFPNWTDRLPDLHIAHHRRYRILFRVTSDAVWIERVIHGARDIEALLDDIE